MINVQLPKFEGPLALLLYLIRKDEMDIMDIKIHEITQQYLDYIKLMKELDLDVAGEFVAMASTLIHIKSRMLLPQYDENGEIVENEDPRKELIQKLLEYQKYQEAAKLLYERPLLGRDIWARGVREVIALKDEEIELEDNALFGLISTYRKLLRFAKKKIHHVTAKTQSIASRILEIKDRLQMGHRVTLMDLVTDLQERSKQALITFLSLLELGKLGYVSLYQTEAYAPIWIEAQKPIDTDIISRVEEYDSVDASQIAEQLMMRAEVDQEFEMQEAEALLLEEAADSAVQEQTLLTANATEDEISLDDIATDAEILLAEQELTAEQEPTKEFDGQT